MEKQIRRQDLIVSKNLRREADALRPKQPKPVKKFTTEEVVDRMITDAVMLEEPFSRFMNIQRTFLKQIQKEIEEKQIKHRSILPDVEDIPIVRMDWVNIIFKRYTE